MPKIRPSPVTAEARNSGWAQLITLLVVGFAVYYLLTAPAGAADAVSNAFGAVMDAFSQVGVFVNELVA